MFAAVMFGFVLCLAMLWASFQGAVRALRKAMREYQEARDDLLAQQQHAAAIRDGAD